MVNAETALAGEQLAVRWFEKHGWEVLARNWTRDIGELDLVVARPMHWGVEQVRLIAFVEVKSRLSTRGPLPEVRVDARKRRKLITLARLYLAEHQLRRCVARFDVVGVDVEDEVVRHYASAFDGSGALR